jgi:citrate lyase subunit beta/citryl-CoA lyase
MTSDLRPRRSVLYMPAANERALEKAKTIAADAIIFDLEDAVAPDAKEAARANACAAASSGEYGSSTLRGASTISPPPHRHPRLRW